MIFKIVVYFVWNYVEIELIMFLRRTSSLCPKTLQPGCTVVSQLAPSPHSNRVSGSIPSWGLSVWSLHVLTMHWIVVFVLVLISDIHILSLKWRK